MLVFRMTEVGRNISTSLPLGLSPSEYPFPTLDDDAAIFDRFLPERALDCEMYHPEVTPTPLSENKAVMGSERNMEV